MPIENVKQPAKIDSEVLAEYVLLKCGKMSHLKLQKLLYYIQAFHLAYFESPLIDDDFEAWLHGPVSKKIYDTIKDFSVLYNDIEFKGNEEQIDGALKFKLTTEQVALIDEVLTEYAALSGTELETLTHSEAPWIEARKECGFGDACRKVISKEAMYNYYKGQLYGSH